MDRLVLPRPVDLHVHFRDMPVLEKVVPYTSRFFSRALAMPNLHPPICTPDSLLRYYDAISMASDDHFAPLMTFKILPETNPSELVHLHKAGAIAGKVYPKGLTTNAEDGVEDYFALFPVFREMEQLDLVLCLHGEKPGKNIGSLNREEAFLKTLVYIARTFPRLRIVMEHITTAAAVNTVLQLPDTVAATITVHHLLLTYDDVGGDKMNPHHFCKPIPKHGSDREALVEAAVSGCPKFFFGSDSAPHDRKKKECSDCCAGIFTAPVALPLLAQIFEEHHALDRLITFVRDSGVGFYSLEIEEMPPITLVKKHMDVPPLIEGIVPFYAGKRLPWSVECPLIL